MTQFSCMSSIRVSQYILSAMVLSILSLSVVPAMAGIIPAFGGASGPGLASMSYNNQETPSPGNDDFVGASPNWIGVHQKAYDSIDYIDFLFIVEDYGVTPTEYILTEGVHNGTGVEWTDYHIELGYGVGGDFVLSGPGDGLDFDAPDQNSPYAFLPFTTLTIGEDTIDAVDGIFPNGAFFVMTFPIDVPNGITEFTVRQYPTVAPVSTEKRTWDSIKAMY